MASLPFALVIEDDPSVASTIQDLLLVLGVDSGVAASYSEAIETISTRLPDLILLDLVLPGGSGFDILHWIRGRGETRAIPVVVLTGEGGPLSRAHGLRLGADAYLTKPLDSDRFRFEIGRLLSAKETPVG